MLKPDGSDQRYTSCIYNLLLSMAPEPERRAWRSQILTWIGKWIILLWNADPNRNVPAVQCFSSRLMLLLLNKLSRKDFSCVTELKLLWFKTLKVTPWHFEMLILFLTRDSFLFLRPHTNTTLHCPRLIHCKTTQSEKSATVSTIYKV